MIVAASGLQPVSALPSIALATSFFSCAESATACVNFSFFGLLFVSPAFAGVISSASISDRRNTPSSERALLFFGSEAYGSASRRSAARLPGSGLILSSCTSCSGFAPSTRIDLSSSTLNSTRFVTCAMTMFVALVLLPARRVFVPPTALLLVTALAVAMFVGWTTFVTVLTTNLGDLMLSGSKTVQPEVSFSCHLLSHATCALSRSGIGASSFFWPSPISFFKLAWRLVCSGVGSLMNGSGFGLLPSMTDSSKLLKNA